MKIEIEHAYTDEFKKLQEEYDRQSEKNKQVIKLENEQKFVEELRKVGTVASVGRKYNQCTDTLLLTI